LRAWGKVDKGMAWNGCSAIANLAVENEANRVRLGAAGACEVVADALHVWGKVDKNVAFYGRRAVSSLAKLGINELKLKELGAISAVVVASMESNSSEYDDPS
jgi:hypothetical protein